MYGGLVPTVRMKQSDFDANPAINEGDWRRINLYIRQKYLPQAAEHSNFRVHHWRYLVWTFTVVMKNTGARPNELLKLRWKDVEIENIGRWSESKQEVEDRFIAYLTLSDSKTNAKREVPANVGDALIRWMKYRLTYLKNNYPDIFEKQGANQPDQLVFGNPANEFKAYSLSSIRNSWNEIVTALHGQLKGHKFSDRRYTIYSMRSTFIEDKLLEGMDIFLLARLCGHSVKVLMTHYERMDIRKRADEITHIEYGRTKKKLKIVDVLTE
jgi:integrase